jgi:NAD(P)-dependent dehydrogenase (short-subunit alcohol dehydrogenase family)
MRKTVIITGGTKGIGAEIASVFYADGYSVVVGSRHDNGLAKKLGERARFVKMDVRREKDHQLAVAFAVKWTGRLDVYINCAGFSGWKPAKAVTEKFWDEMIDTNLKGAFWGCKTAGAHLSPNGVIINISSLAGKRGSSNNSVYCASKFGVTGLTQALAKEFGPSGIRVVAVCPVYVETDGVMNALKDTNSPAKGKNVKEYLKDFTKTQTALGVLPTGKNIAETCLFLASPSASAITGQSLNVDCGVLPQ